MKISRRPSYRIAKTGAPPALEQEIAEHETRSQSLFENFMQEHGVPRGGDTKILSRGWLQDAPEGDQVVRDPKGPRMTTQRLPCLTPKPETEHPNFQLPPSWQADYPIFPNEADIGYDRIGRG